MLGLEALTGSLDDFGFEDYLNGKINPYNSSDSVLYYTFSSLGRAFSLP